jgi:hypothetical protein
MGFDLQGVLVFHPATLGLFDRIIEGGSRFRLPVPDNGGSLPSGFWLPLPELIAYDQSLEVMADWYAPHSEHEWRARIGMPAQDPPGFSFGFDEFRMASFLSLAGPPGVMLLNDGSFGGVLDREHAATFVAGRLVKAAGLDYQRPVRYVLEGKDWLDTSPGDPTSDCAAVLHPVLGKYNLYDADYLPRDGTRGCYQPMERAALVPIEGNVAGWSDWFPALG